MLFNKKTDKPQADALIPEIAAAPAPLLFDVTDADFEQTVLVISMEKPVIVDFSSPRAAISKQLTPILEKLVLAAGGAVSLARMNVDENPGVASALKIKSLPTVYAFFQGRPVDGFQGAAPETQVKTFIDQLVRIAKQAAPDAIDVPETLKLAAAALAEKNFAGAQDLYAQILYQDQTSAAAYVGLVRTLIAAGDVAQAQSLVDSAPPEISKAPAFSEARTALELAQNAPTGSLKEFEEKLAKDPADHQARYDLAIAQFTGGEKEAGMDNLLEIIRRNRGWNDEAARLQLLKFFEALGPADPLTLQGRRKLSSILFS